MKNMLRIAMYAVVVVALALVALDFFYLNKDSRAMAAIATVTGWSVLILFSASHSSELEQGRA